MNTGLLMMVGLTFARGLVAQTPAHDSAIRWSSLAERPRLLDTTRTASVRYPDLLRSSSVAGVVELEVVIDTSGIVRPAIRVDSSTHDLFTSAAKTAIRNWRFTPASIDGHAVSITAPVRIDFMFPRSGAPWIDTTSVQSDSTGIHIVLGLAEIPQTFGVRFTPADSISARVALMIAAVQTPGFGEKSRGPICFRWDASARRVPIDVFRIIKSKMPEARNVDECPRTQLAPTWVDISGLRLWTQGVAIANLTTSQGNSGTTYFCHARRNSSNDWVALCKPQSVWVSMS